MKRFFEPNKKFPTNKYLHNCRHSLIYLHKILVIQKRFLSLYDIAFQCRVGTSQLKQDGKVLGIFVLTCEYYYNYVLSKIWIFLKPKLSINPVC